MRNVHCLMFSAALLFPLAGDAAQAQAPGPGSGKIVCWKDKAGKVVGCGDKVPPEYQDNATKELNRRGVTIKQSEAALTPEQRKAQQAELERKQAEDLKKEVQRRQGQGVAGHVYHGKGNRSQAQSRHPVDRVEYRSAADQSQERQRPSDRCAHRIEQYKKNKKPVPPAIQEDSTAPRA